MKPLFTTEQKPDKVKYENYKRLIRNLRRGKVEKINYKQIGDNFRKGQKS